ncbi:MAG: DUF84 family protein [Bdellovibrionales bacterium]
MKVVLGSKNAAKVAAVEKALRAYWDDVVVTGIDVPSGVPAQPLGHDETMRGAINRARAAYAASPDCDMAVGLEGGVVDIAGQPVLMGYAVVTDGARECVVPTAGIPLPYAWGEALKAGAELRPYVMATGLDYDYNAGTPGVLTNNRIMREDMFGMALTAAMAPWVNPQAYEKLVETAAA